MPGTGSVDTDMRDANITERLEMIPMSIGPFLVEVPGDWEIVDHPDQRVTVLREPISSDDHLLCVPGFVIPNIVLRFFELPSSKGGVARSATQEAAATFDALPGTVLLAILPLSSREGLPGRAHVMSGFVEGQPFISSRWHIGDGISVLEITVTGPATSMPDLMEIGQNVAESVRTTIDSYVDIELMIPEDLQDRDMMHTLLEQSAASGTAKGVPGLELVSPILAARDRQRIVPETLPLDPGAWSSLSGLSPDASKGRLLRPSAPLTHEGLVRAGLAAKHGLTDEGARWAELLDVPLSLTVRGERHDGYRFGEIRLDGMDCLVSLDLPFPTDREVDPHQEGTRLGGALLTVGLPTVLLDWCGLRADWFADLQATALLNSGAHLPKGDGRDASPWAIEAGGDVMKGVLAGEGTHWTVALPGGEPQLSWFQPDHRGPLLVLGEDGGHRVRLESTTGMVLHESLSRLFRDIARSYEVVL